MNEKLLAFVRSQAESIRDWDTDTAVGFLREIYLREHPFDPVATTAEIQEAHALAQSELAKPTKRTTKGGGAA